MSKLITSLQHPTHSFFNTHSVLASADDRVSRSHKESKGR
jgi:hypothetical protein